MNILFQPKKIPFEWGDLPALDGYHALFTLEPAWRSRHQFNSRLRLMPRELGVVLGLVDELEHELKVREVGYGVMATTLFLQIVALLSRYYRKSPNPDSRALLRIAQTISHLETNYDQPINLDELARMAHMSKRGFMRTFASATGNSPIAYLIQLRVNRAANLLRHSEDSITDIAFQVGFGDSNYFTRQFTKLLGVSPTSYRRQRQPG